MTSTAQSARCSLRPSTPGDRDFLLTLYGTTRDDLALVPLAEDQREDLVRMQFHAQDVHFRQTNPVADFDIVEVDGRPAGRLYVDRRTDDIRIVDISLLPEHRGGGLGGALVRALQDEARATGRSVSLHVARGNRAEALYHRLGFRLAGDLGVYRLLVWRAP
jgi:ribosomal protein S18 acetylase RimI-like enzyme